LSQDTNTGKKKALIISVSDYSNNIHPLPFCKNDGERMYDTLHNLGFDIPESNKLVGKVNWQTMRDTLSDFFTRLGINSKDTLLFYFSGHGLVYNDKFYLATSEIDPSQPFKRGIDEGFLHDIIDSSPSRRIVMILDSCHSGKLTPFSKGNDQSAASVASDTVNRINIAEGRSLLASCKGYQESFGTDDGSKFTQYVIEGIKGNKNSVDKDGYVTPTSLSKYIYDEMMDHPEKDGTIQKPIMKIEGSGDIILAIHEEFRAQSSGGFSDSEDIQKAVQETEKARQEAEKLNYQGLTLMEIGKYDEARLYFDKALEKYPKYVIALYNKGFAFHSQHLFEKAIPWYDKALEIDPENVDALNGKGNVLTSLGKYEDAMKYFDKAIEINPKYDIPLYSKGNALCHLDRYEEAISYYDKALVINPQFDAALSGKKWAQSKLNKDNVKQDTMDGGKARQANASRSTRGTLPAGF